MRALLALALTLTLTACGADGPPVKPSTEASISISGDATFGVTTTIN